MKPALLALPTLALALSACGNDARKDAGAGKAEGEVLEGSVSDAMLPLGQVRSQPPLAPRVAQPGDGPKDKPASSEKGDSPVEPAPAESDSGPGPAPESAPE